MKPKTKRIVLSVAIALVVVGYALLLWRGPWWIDGAHLRSNNLQPADGVVITGFRTMLVALGAGAVAAIGLYYTHKGHKQTEALFTHTREKDREQAELTREGQVTERYIEAIKLLSSDSVTQRLGGIYSLERIMRDSAKDHWTVVEVLAAFIRQRAAGKSEGQPADDVQAALTVLGRRDPQSETRDRIDLTYVDLSFFDLTSAGLPMVNFYGADLSKAVLPEANLKGALLYDTCLREAIMVNVDLGGALLLGADLRGAILFGARLTGADLRDTDLRGAVLASGKLEAVCDAEALSRARLDSTTKLPAAMVDDRRIIARIEEVETAAREEEARDSEASSVGEQTIRT
ncbi:pentapeptide repeat-containing protein [Streptomyces sp. NPDC020800]|uniref:pentapeptide repeat-containing protein n=1 Tax=Streptomyces sp. NPDC020800 TaxID=3365092 RepID=UPI00379D3B05